MKTVIAFFMLSSAVFTSCKNSSETEVSNASPVNLAASCAHQCADYSKEPPFNYIDPELLTEMENNYKRSSNNTDALAVWFSLDTLKRFIWEIEKRMCEQHCTAAKGIRIYYARYPNIDPASISKYKNLSNVDVRFGNLHTVFMVPTYRDGDQNVDFTIFKEGACSKGFKAPDDGQTSKEILALSPDGRNHGELCPPLCAGSFLKSK